MKQGYISLTEIAKVYGLTEIDRERIRKNAKKWGCPSVKIDRKLHFPTDKVFLLLDVLKTWERHKKHSKTPEYTDIEYCAAMMGKTKHNFYQLAKRHGVRSRFVKINGCWKVRTPEAYEIMKQIDTPISKK